MSAATVAAAAKALPLLAVAAGGSALLVEDSRLRMARTVDSTRRVVNVVGVVGVMATDYAYHYYWKQKEMTRNVDILEETLSVKRRAFNSKFGRMMDEGDPRQRRALQSQLDEEKRGVDALAASVASLVTARESDNRALHERNSRRLRDMCASNGGVYIKLGQHLAMLDHILPPEYQVNLRTLLDRNPSSTMASVAQIFREDFSAAPGDMFDQFDPVPIASASLAQVHVAWKDGKKYAVKVQHAGLLEGSTFDRLVITTLVDQIPRLFPDFDYAWLTKEMNQNMPKELDFGEELRNLERARRTLRERIERGDVALPVPVPASSSRRVLTMSFEEGCYLHQMDQHPQLQLDKADVADLVSSIFCDQIFRHGFVHCDPHEANLLVRAHPSQPTRPQVVLLDHGLYRQLDESFRRDYCRLWQAIMLVDEKGIEEACKRMNAGAAYPLLAAMLTLKPWDDILSDDLDRLHGGRSASEAALLRSYAKQYFKEIVHLLGQVPSDLLLLFKTNDCLRHIDSTLNTPVNSTATAAAVASDVVLREDLAEAAQTLRGWALLSRVVSALWTWCRVRVRVALLHGLRWVVQLERALDTWVAAMLIATSADREQLLS